MIEASVELWATGTLVETVREALTEVMSSEEILSRKQLLPGDKVSSGGQSGTEDLL